MYGHRLSLSAEDFISSKDTGKVPEEFPNPVFVATHQPLFTGVETQTCAKMRSLQKVSSAAAAHTYSDLAEP
jgi:hypothetical protein